ncbi:aldo/keto reductase [Saccharibacillus sp. CPCC 101409]|uniref:aldo/keto reductase n=1 Tax=Saccharibacillus sp. CPCC 101409 TaxID=3058041 RepID=UPI002671FA61|nr:aldo/keto reductase [Saccharibacillus sp. CPCC 101409]MDO3409876.1 aldo/keto reductase [Saccharibacillus sp. CPCC 101409]
MQRPSGGILAGSGGADKAPSGSRAQTDPNFGRFLNERYLELGRAVGELAEEAGTAPGTLSLSWLLRRPAVSTVIVGATKPEQVEQNLCSVGLRPDAALLEKLDEIRAPFRDGEPFAVYHRLS